MQLKFYHASYYEKFHFGINGEKQNEVKNMDKDIFRAVNSDKYGGSSSISKGCVPGILYEFSSWKCIRDD